MRDQSDRLLPFWARGVSFPYRTDTLPFWFTSFAQRTWNEWQEGRAKIGYWEIVDPFPVQVSRSLERLVLEDTRSARWWDFPNLMPELLAQLDGEFKSEQVKFQHIAPTAEARKVLNKPQKSSLIEFFNTHLYVECFHRYKDSVDASLSNKDGVVGQVLPIRPLPEMSYWVAEFEVGSSNKLVLFEALSDVHLGCPGWIEIWTHGQRTREYLKKPAHRIDPNWSLLPQVIASAQWNFLCLRAHTTIDAQRNQ